MSRSKPSSVQSASRSVRVAAALEALEARRLLSTVPTGFSDSRILSGLDHPDAMVQAPDGRLFVCEQGGDLRVVKNGKLMSAPFVTLPTHIDGSRGLLDVMLDPKFSSNGYLYLFWTRTNGSTVVNRLS